ncbi:helix-turn-helix domain-containing protein, partial [Peptococcaceae bacterium]|nr:helix-turn-helix domain-containing protein [Peptococcaceae bacterium]
MNGEFVPPRAKSPKWCISSKNLSSLSSLFKQKEIMTVKQVAQYLQMDEHTIYKLSRFGKIPALKITGLPKYQLIPYLSDQTSI